MFVIDVKKLEDGPVTIRGNIELDWLGGELSACEYDVEPVEAKIDLTIEAMGSGVLVKGTATARVRTECGICLARTDLDLDSDISSFVSRRDREVPIEEDAELTPEDLEREWYAGDTLILDDLIRDALMLELPMNPRCGEDCAGMPRRDREEPEEPTIDPRLAPLASIKISKE